MPTGTLTRKIHSHESVSREDAAEQQSNGSAADRDRRPDAERLRTVGALLEGRRHDRQRGRGDERRPETLEAAGHDQERRARRERAQERRNREEHHAGEEDLLRPIRSPARPPSRRKPPNISV